MIECPTKGAAHQALPFPAITEAGSVCQPLPVVLILDCEPGYLGVHDHRDCYRVTCAEPAIGLSACWSTNRAA
jgi:hypothetical protein